jgi:hypothetical protein
MSFLTEICVRIIFHIVTVTLSEERKKSTKITNYA